MSKTQSTATKLSDTQLVILRAGAQRADGSLLPFPQSLTAKGAALGTVIETLSKRKLAQERPTVDGAAEWRRDDGGRPLGLFITTSGLLALGVDDAEKTGPCPSMPCARFHSGLVVVQASNCGARIRRSINGRRQPPLSHIPVRNLTPTQRAYPLQQRS